jgi:FAD/FMN-containing dehydrogenase
LIPDWPALGSSLAGAVLLPGEPGYEEARRPRIPRFGAVEPEAVARCATPADVREALRFAHAERLPMAIRSGGHCFDGRSSTEGLLIDVSPLDEVTVEGEVATVGAGVRLGNLYDALLEHGITIPAGCGPTVGVSGLVLGGGLGILGRRYGLTSDSLLAAQVVLADGRIVTCDAEREPDLLWALRGGGVGLGVVTTLRFTTVAAPELTVFHLRWPRSAAREVIDAWQGWAPQAPNELAASLLVKAPGEVERPATVNVFGSLIGDRGRLTELLAGLVAGAGVEPETPTVEELPFRDAKRRLVEIGAAMGGEGEEAAAEGDPYSKSEYFRRPLPAEAISALIEQFEADREPGQARELDFTPWAGAYNRVAPDATAFPHRDALFLLKHGAEVEANSEAAEREAARRWLRGSWELVHPSGSGGAYPNFPDPELEDPERAYFGGNLERLREVRRRYDPDGVFTARSTESIRPG